MIGLLALTAVVSVFILNVHHRGDVYPRPHRVLRLIFLEYLARVVCMHSLVSEEHSGKDPSKVSCGALIGWQWLRLQLTVKPKASLGGVGRRARTYVPLIKMMTQIALNNNPKM